MRGMSALAPLPRVRFGSRAFKRCFVFTMALNLYARSCDAHTRCNVLTGHPELAMTRQRMAGHEGSARCTERWAPRRLCSTDTQMSVLCLARDCEDPGAVAAASRPDVSFGRGMGGAPAHRVCKHDLALKPETLPDAVTVGLQGASARTRYRLVCAASG